MLISVNWLRDFVDIPADLDAKALADRFTITTAEVEGVEHLTQLPEGVRLPPGGALAPREREDWLIEVDNKSITHRPDLWGHYGIAREVAAMLGLPLKPYPAKASEAAGDPKGATIPIEIDDPSKCPRYSALLITGLKTATSPAAMQVRLARCGMRPISFLVDLTNYIMLEIGQPMHAFDGGRLTRIEVATAAPGEKFRTLDGIERVMPAGTLMIQSNRKSVAIAGIMGGAETEVSPATTTVLLESANFDAATVRRAAAGMSLRTEASARFEKSLDPNNTVLGIARFVQLAREQFPNLGFASKLSDAYPRPLAPKPIEVDAGYAARFIGKDVSSGEMTRILTALEFAVETRGDKLRVTPPSFRATKDISIEADVIEEVSRSVGYDRIEPALPAVTTRYIGLNPDLRLERLTLEHFCRSGPYFEVHGYIWYDDAWLGRIGFEPGPCITLRNPAAAGCSKLRQTLVPGLLAAVEKNRHHLQQFDLLELGSVFHTKAGGAAGDNDEVSRAQARHVGLAVAAAGAKEADAVWNRLKSAIEGYGTEILDGSIRFGECEAGAPWEDAARLAEVRLDGQAVGRIAMLALACKQRIDERLRGWSAAVGEIDLTGLGGRLGRRMKLGRVPEFPRVRMDFSFMADQRRRYAQIADDLRTFESGLLQRLSYVGSFEGGAVPAGKRSFTVRAELGLADRTLTDGDAQKFRDEFTAFLKRLGLELRS